LADVFSKRKRSQIMSRVRSTNTTPELVVKALLRRYKFRYSSQMRKLPGNPDFVIPAFRIAIFVHGCFWHQHRGCQAVERPSSNTEYWNRKLDRNLLRDRRNIRSLCNLAWTPFIIWECQLRKINLIEKRLVRLTQESSHRLRPSLAQAGKRRKKEC
jgi:DNA mismatch endonuclease (patch repair protein)